MNISRLSVNNPIGTAMVFIAILVVGLISISSLPRDVMPDMDFPTLTVITVYPGASPEDVESGVTSLLEAVLASTPNLQGINSVSRENVSIITLQFQWESNISDAANDARDIMELIKNDLPSAAQSPFIMKINSAMLPVVALAVSAEESYDNFDHIYRNIISPRLSRIDGVGTVFPIANPEKELLIEVDPVQLSAYGLTLQNITAIFKAEQMSIPAGSLKVGDYDLSVSVPSSLKDFHDVENLVISQFNNKAVHLKDVAKLNVRLKPKDEKVYSGGKRSIALFVQKQTGYNTLSIYKSVLEEMEEIKKYVPADVEISEIFNTADMIEETIKNLTSTVWLGAMWVMLVVLLFLRNIRSSLIIILTIPFSLITAFIVIYLFDYTINIFSLMSLVIAMGMVVDSAIVVLENIIQKIEKGERPREASIFGAGEMGTAITGSIFTTIAVFVPLLFLGGIVGVMFKQLVVITTAILLASLLAALTLTPMLSSKLIRVRKKEKSKLFLWSERMFQGLEMGYKKMLAWAVWHKTAVVVIAFSIFGLSIFSIRFIGTDYIPEFDSGDMILTFQTDEGTAVEKTENIAIEIEALVREHVPYVTSSYIIAGQTEKGLLSSIGFTEGKNSATVGFRFNMPEERDLNSTEIALEVDKLLKDIPELDKYSVGGAGVLSAVVLGNQKPVEVKLFGNDFEKLDEAIQKISDALYADGNFYNIEIPSSRNKPEFKFEVDRARASSMGLNNLLISMQMRQSLYGAGLGKISLDGQNLGVVVKYEEEYIKDIDKINNLQLINTMGQKVRIGDIATVEPAFTYQEIVREGQQRLFRISADMKNISLGEAFQRVQDIVDDAGLDENISVVYDGQVSEQSESFDDLALAFMVGLMLVYMILAALFKSLKYPFIILFTVPFTITGVIFAFLLTGTTLSLVTFTGVIMLIGVVVNNGIILVDYTNLLRGRGLQLSEAIQEAGRSRLRPVLMTTITTVIAMVPMAISKTMGSEIWSPLGITMIGGLLVSTLITLVLVPVVYALMNLGTLRKERK
ncbi:MAG: efflux RND transporter permease subunit [Bacteroidales bacterium]